MTDDIDRRLASLFAEADRNPDSAFADRIVALVAHDRAVQLARRRAALRVGKEALGLAATLTSFVILSRVAPNEHAAGMGDTLSFGAPAMLGLAFLAIWGLIVMRPANA